MAEERTLATARAAEITGDDDTTKAELQRRMEEARESIAQTVTEIKDTVVNQYNSVRDTVTETLDWREQYRKRPLAWSVGALSVGLLVGYTVAGAFKGDDYDDYDEDDYIAGKRDWDLRGEAEDVGPARRGILPAQPRSYAAQAITGGPYGSTEYAQAAPRESFDTQSQPQTSASTALVPTSTEQPEEEEEKGPGLIQRFKETRAYDRLEEEVSALGDRALEELSRTAQNIVLPLIFSKIKDLFGLDLSGKKQEQTNAPRGQQQQGTGGGTAERANTANAS